MAIERQAYWQGIIETQVAWLWGHAWLWGQVYYFALSCFLLSAITKKSPKHPC